MTRSTRTGRPPVHLIDTEADNLTNLALGVADTMPQVSELLMSEIARATVHRAARMPSDVVTMHSTVEFTDEGSGAERTVQLVYPAEADISNGRISILTPVGAGLIGLREGHSIRWPDREGRERQLTIQKVTQPARGD
ncbi:nucleoside diphosphate kinase regulator [Hyphomicrobium sp.]|uniref:nucleoside diphosphate kinase regulator n=1 Tax=Hyphomicrobium sp. TaxID=82 RepID=UPI001DA79B4F|nr:nucleoside diphosphate kinase regulator [Hyphomicrobium sp.]MBY0560878.1 nucleoside diphosphate kinase regulator [Hyphomicrobium sp.]